MFVAEALTEQDEIIRKAMNEKRRLLGMPGSVASNSTEVCITSNNVINLNRHKNLSVKKKVELMTKKSWLFDLSKNKHKPNGSFLFIGLNFFL